jgi:hypothetical protein
MIQHEFGKDPGSPALLFLWLVIVNESKLFIGTKLVSVFGSRF